MTTNQYAKNCELVVGIVAPVGINLDDVQNRLTSLLEQFQYKLNWIHLSKLSQRYVEQTGATCNSELERLNQGMNNGNYCREKFQRGDFFALLAINQINEMRKVDSSGNTEPSPRVAHVIRSLKHPDEVETLRRTYGDGFFLLGVSSSIKTRRHFLHNVKGIPQDELDRLIGRDDREVGDFGQRTRDVFQMADAFVTTDDNTRLSDQLSRILDLLFSAPAISPTADEYAMFLAYAASLRSADLSRQVGAVIANRHMDIIATGANDVPKFGGGLYWPNDEDQRDHIRKEDYNEREKRNLTLKIMKKFKPESTSQDEELLHEGLDLLKDTGILDITEYGRAVHAEMEALLSAARNGISVRDCTLYTTTFPCHNCTKHIVAAGIKEVKFVEPYPKSFATKMHDDSIETNGDDTANKVQFEPFVGIGPRRFVDLFSMNLGSGRNLTRKHDGRLIHWDRSNAELRVPMTPLSYLEAEVSLVNKLANVIQERGVKS
ncbi:anti-phage dCTP deaminase [Limnobacter sp. P1]|uniref:anti-phage dCTP deaminase n=1 Tax=Limnobacter olei TaxID=3031298 RepID=UPI0023B1438F|nr:anti-phage dCTP deaminase [Limnobacter sp. P1]